MSTTDISIAYQVGLSAEEKRHECKPLNDPVLIALMEGYQLANEHDMLIEAFCNGWKHSRTKRFRR